MTATRYWLLATGCWLLAPGCGRTDRAGYEARGTVEVPEVDLAAMAPARVIAIKVDEGAVVRAGDTLARLTQTDLPASFSAQRARVATAEANLRDLQAGSRPQEIAQARDALTTADAQAAAARQALERARSLIATNGISRQQYDDAVTADQVAQARVGAAQAALSLAEAGSRPERIAAARAEVASARAALEQVEARASDLVLVTPVDGIVLGRHAEPSEALGMSVPVLTIGETGRPFVRVYVPQAIVSGLTVGSPADILVGPTRILRGRIAAINPKAEFTPRVALTEEERADLMFGVKVEFENPGEAPHPGLWVVVRMPEGRTGRRADGQR